MNNTTGAPQITRKDFHLVTLIGVCFALFSLPIMTNLGLPFIKISLPFVIALVAFFGIFANIALACAWFIGKKIPVIFQLAKFGAVGAFNTFFDWGILNLLMITFHISSGFGFSLFKSISFVAAATGAYFWNKYWTFNATEKTTSQEVIRFIAVSTSGFLINVGLASLIVFAFYGNTALTGEQLANVAAAIATLASLVWNFVGYKIFVFKK